MKVNFLQIEDMAMVYFRDNYNRTSENIEVVVKQLANFCEYEISHDEIEKITATISNMA